MPKYKLTYFDFSGSRGEECRLALFVAGVDFEDRRIARGEWATLKPTTPYGSLPVLELENGSQLAQSNAILSYVGRRYGLCPDDPWTAARHEAILVAVEVLRADLGPTGKSDEPAEKRRAREEFASDYLQTWGAQIERQIEGPFVAGERISIADIKLYQILQSFKSGTIDHISPSVFQAFPKLEGVHDAVNRHPKVMEWRSKH